MKPLRNITESDHVLESTQLVRQILSQKINGDISAPSIQLSSRSGNTSNFFFSFFALFLIVNSVDDTLTSLHYQYEDPEAITFSNTKSICKLGNATHLLQSSFRAVFDRSPPESFQSSLCVSGLPFSCLSYSISRHNTPYHHEENLP